MANDFKAGDRVRLVHMRPDPWSRVKEGDEGTVSFIDSLGTVHVKWDSGSALGVLLDEGDVLAHI